jgi:hypothetical protein
LIPGDSGERVNIFSVRSRPPRNRKLTKLNGLLINAEDNIGFIESSSSGAHCSEKELDFCLNGIELKIVKVHQSMSHCKINCLQEMRRVVKKCPTSDSRAKRGSFCIGVHAYSCIYPYSLKMLDFQDDEDQASQHENTSDSGTAYCPETTA